METSRRWTTTTRTATKPFTILAAALIAAYGSGAALAQTPPPGPKEVRPEAFDSPGDAAKALIAAASNDSNDDTRELTAVLGSVARGILTSGNGTQDRAELREFSKLASAKNHIRISSIDSSTAVLFVGNEDWPFPIPLVRTGQRWHFDPAMGNVEMEERRLGADELDAVESCMAYVSAQQAYVARELSGKGPPAYAQKIMSSPGGKDGLYWPGASEELVSEVFAAAEGSPGRGAKPYRGYYFRVLREQGPNAPGGAHSYVTGGAMIGGFALIGWPAEYGVTGIHTFIVNRDGHVFEKDLGPRTPALIVPIVRYDPDSSWTLVD